MIEMTGLEGIPAFNAQLSLELARFDREISAAFEAWTRKLFKELVENTPQWTGDLAAAWNYSVNVPDMNYSPIPNKVENNQFWSAADIYQRGAEPAVGMALTRATLVKPTWRDTVFFHNPAPIAEKVENWRILIRPVNLVNGHVAMVQYLVDKYSITGGSP